MITIKLSLPGFNDVDISQFTGNANNTLKGCIFYINRDDITTADYWVCIEEPYRAGERCHVKKSNMFFLTAEVAWPRFFYDHQLKKNYLAQFGKIFTCHDIFADNVVFSLPYLPWMINANHGKSIFSKHSRDRVFFEQLNMLPKTKSLSVFCSNQAWTDEHKLRLKFVNALKTHFGDELDWYGNGIRSLDQKWDGIAPYRYHLALENQSRNNVITEKLYDSFLGLAYPIYYGAPNAGDYFDSNSFSTIDIMDLKGSIKKIEQVLESNLYEQRSSAIIASKNLVLSKYNLFERIADICTTAQSNFADSQLSVEEDAILMPISQFDVKHDLSVLLKSNHFRLIFKRILFYYPSYLLQKLSSRLLRKYGA